MQLFKAHNQWKTRPADERFQTLQAMNEVCLAYRNSAAEASLPYADVRVEAQDGDLKLVGRTGTPALLTHWSMGQLCNRAAAPASYLRNLPATLAAQNLNHGLKARADAAPVGDSASLLFHQQESGLVLRAALSESYTRIWNSDITRRLLALQQANPQWTNPMAYKVIAPSAGGGWPTMSGEMEPAGLYASDHDMFAFLVDESKTFEGSPQGLNRGFFVWNSEVGSSSFGVMTFLYDRVCGNNIVWGAQGVMELKIRHVGDADGRAFHQLGIELRRYSESATGQIETMISRARAHSLGSTKEEVLDNVFGMARRLKLPELTQTRIGAAIDLAVTREDRYGSPHSLWGVVGGLTEASQFEQYADKRTEVDRAAGRLLKSIAF